MKRRTIIMRFCADYWPWLAAAVGQATGDGRRGWSGHKAPAAQENVIWASGKLLPARWAALSPAAGGT